MTRGSAPPGPPAPAPPPLAVPVPDTHCHLDLVVTPEEPLPPDPAGPAVAGAVAAARAAGVGPLITVGVDVASSRWSAAAARAHDGLYAAVAIHPNESQDLDAAALAEISRLARLPAVRAVGETGLDYYRDTATPTAQQAAFRAHIAIAKQVGKPLVIHDREAHEDVLAILAEEGPPDRVIFHCFSGDAAFARRCADRGYLLSFAGTLTFRSAGALREAAAAVPRELLLVETDAPFLAPTPHRGRPNAPYLVPLTVRALAEVTGTAEDELAATIAATAERVFGWPARRDLAAL